MANDISKLIRPGFGMKIVEKNDFDWDEWNGRMLVWEPPQSYATYAIGVDPAEGVGADRSVCQVIKVGTVDYPDQQVAEFACDFLDPVDFASCVKTIGEFYRDSEGMEAFCTVECNAPCGDTLVNDLRMRLDYSNLFVWKAYDRLTNMYTNKLGWWTNRTTRPKIIARGLHAFANGDLIVNSTYTLDEMQDFERDHFIAKARARSGRHDDRVMALLIGFWGAHDDEWMAGEDLAEERRLRKLGAKHQEMQMYEKPSPTLGWGKPDYQNSAITWKQALERADSMLLDD